MNTVKSKKTSAKQKTNGDFTAQDVNLTIRRATIADSDIILADLVSDKELFLERFGTTDVNYLIETSLLAMAVESDNGKVNILIFTESAKNFSWLDSRHFMIRLLRLSLSMNISYPLISGPSGSKKSSTVRSIQFTTVCG